MKLSYIALALVTTVASGCSSSNLSCSDETVIDLVKDIAFDDDMSTIRYFGWKEPAREEYKYSVQSIRLKDNNSETGKITCAAELGKTINDKVLKAQPIEYTAQTTNDGEVFVEVYGL